MRHLSLLLLALALATPLWAQDLVAEVGSIDVGQVLYGCPVSATFRLINTSSSPVVISKVDTGCGCTAAQYPSAAIAAGATAEVVVTYDARLLGHFDKIIIISTAAGAETEVEMKGIVVAEVDDYAARYPFLHGSLAADCTAIGFDEVVRGETVTQKFHIYNPTSTTVAPQLLHLPSYLSATVSPSSVAPGGSATVAVTFSSSSLHSYGHVRTHVYLAAHSGEKVASDKRINIDILLLPSTEDIDSLTGGRPPQLVLSSTRVSLPTSGKRRATVDVQNVGNGPLTIYDISILPAGYQLRLSKKRLATGEKGRLTITASKHTAPTAAHVVLITDDPSQPKVTITVVPQ